jgi:hypothetical protein
MAPVLRNRDGLVRLRTKRMASPWLREAWLIAGLVVACLVAFGWILISR